MTDDEAEEEYEEIDQLQSEMDEAGPPGWAHDADDPENYGEQFPD